MKIGIRCGTNIHSGGKVMRSEELNDKCLAVYRASLELIAEQGFHGTPMSQIAQKAGVGVGSIYRYFKDKEDLIHGLHAQADREMIDALAATYVAGSSEKDQFFALVTTLTKHLIDNPLEFKFLEQYYNSPYGTEKKREKFFEEIPVNEDERPFLSLLKGEAFKDLPIPALHALAFGPLILSVRDHLSGIQTLDEELINQIAGGCWDAVRKS